jgi:group I intron endonuclease
MSLNPPGRAHPLVLLCYEYASLTQALNALGDDLPDTFLKTKPRKAQIQIISYRLIAGWSPEEAFGYFPPPKSAQKGYAQPLRCAGKEFPSKSALAKSLGVTKKLLGQRLSREKWSVEVAAGVAAPPHYLANLGNKVGCIYMWNHKPSNKKYVGLTIDTHRRNWQHALLSKSKNAAPGTLQHAMAEHGRDQFEFLILEDNIPAADLPSRERYWIKMWGSLKPYGYNQNAGGVFGGIGSPIIVDGIAHSGFTTVADHYKMTIGKLKGRMNIGWSIEDAVGLTGRKPKTRSPIILNICSTTREHPSKAAACRFWGLRHSDVKRSVQREGKTWENAIIDALVAMTYKNMEHIEPNPGMYGAARRLPRLQTPLGQA